MANSLPVGASNRGAILAPNNTHHDSRFNKWHSVQGSVMNDDTTTYHHYLDNAPTRARNERDSYVWFWNFSISVSGPEFGWRPPTSSSQGRCCSSRSANFHWLISVRCDNDFFLLQSKDIKLTREPAMDGTQPFDRRKKKQFSYNNSLYDLMIYSSNVGVLLSSYIL